MKTNTRFDIEAALKQPIFSNCKDAAEPPTGWAVLKGILSGDKELSRRTRLVEVTVGERYLKLLAQKNLTIDEQFGGEQFSEEDPYEFLEGEDYFTTRLSKDSSDELTVALEEANELLDNLKLVGYKVDYHNPLFGWRHRNPRLGDIVSIPQDLWADINSQEPEEDRPTKGALEHRDDDRWVCNRHRRENLGFSQDFRRSYFTGTGEEEYEVSVTITLEDFIDQKERQIAEFADKNELPTTVAAVVLFSRLADEWQVNPYWTRQPFLGHDPWATLYRVAKDRRRLKPRYEPWRFQWLLKQCRFTVALSEADVIDNHRPI